MPAGAERDPRPAVDQVLLARVEVAARVERVRLREVLRDPVRHRRRRADHRAHRDAVAADLDLLLDHAQQQDQRRVQPQRLLDRRLQNGDLAQRLEGHLASVHVELVQLGDDAVHDVGVAQQLDERPRRGAGRSVVPGEHHRDEHAGDLVGREARLAGVVLQHHQHVEHVPLPLLRGTGSKAAIHDVLYQVDEREARSVAAPEALDRRVRVDEGVRVGAALQVVVQRGEPAVQLLAEARADQARRGRVDGQLGEPVEQVDLALLAPARHHAADLALDRRGVPLHLLAAQRGVAQHLLAPLRRGVEDDALAEHGRHERVRLALVEHLVGRAEERLVRPGAADQHDVAAGEGEQADVAALRAHAVQQADRVGAQVLQVPVRVAREVRRDARDGQLFSQFLSHGALPRWPLPG